MKIEGLDRVTMMVKNLDKAHEFFSNVLGVEFIEVKDPIVETAGLRCSLSLDHQIELMSPAGPLTESCPPHIKRFAKLLEDKDNVIVGLSFRVKDPTEAAAELERKGVRIESRFDLEQFCPVQNLKEVILREEDTLGIMMSFVRYGRL